MLWLNVAYIYCSKIVLQFFKSDQSCYRYMHQIDSIDFYLVHVLMY